jgi:hypothetical protein
MKIINLAWFFFMLFCPQLVWAKKPSYLDKVPAIYDQNGDGLLNEGMELNVFLKHHLSPQLKKFDKNLNGMLDGEEVRLLLTSINDPPLLQSHIEQSENYMNDNNVVKVAAKPKPKPPVKDKVPKLKSNSGLLLRSAYSPFSLLSERPKQSAKGLAKVSPALASYSRDNQSDSNELALSGSLSVFHRKPFRQDDAPLPGMEAIAYSAGIVFDRKISSAPNGTNTNVLAFKFNGDMEFVGWPIFNRQYISTGVELVSDFDFDTAIIAGSIQWQPTHNSFAIGVTQSVGNLPLEYRWQPALRIEYQNIADDGGQAQLMGMDDFAFIGPIVEGQLFLDFLPIRGAFLDGKYRLMKDLLGNGNSYDYFEASANFPLDENNHFLFSFRYREGNLPVTRQAVDDILIGIGFRY